MIHIINAFSVCQEDTRLPEAVGQGSTGRVRRVKKSHHNESKSN